MTTLYQKVGDNMTQESASENLISTLQGFKLKAKDAGSIVDRINEVNVTASIYSNVYALCACFYVHIDGNYIGQRLEIA